MAENDDFEIDPAIAASMGFSSFGDQVKKKRKYEGNDAFIDPDASLSTDSPKLTGANAMNVTSSPKRVTEPVIAQKSVNTDIAPRAGDPASGYVGPAGYVSKYSLEELRRGVKNENGDMVYFQPCFIEDPWAKFDQDEENQRPEERKQMVANDATR
jgi:hypothetical protein